MVPTLGQLRQDHGDGLALDVPKVPDEVASRFLAILPILVIGRLRFPRNPNELAGLLVTFEPSRCHEHPMLLLRGIWVFRLVEPASNSVAGVIRLLAPDPPVVAVRRRGEVVEGGGGSQQCGHVVVPEPLGVQLYVGALHEFDPPCRLVHAFADVDGGWCFRAQRFQYRHQHVGRIDCDAIGAAIELQPTHQVLGFDVGEPHEVRQDRGRLSCLRPDAHTDAPQQLLDVLGLFREKTLPLRLQSQSAQQREAEYALVRTAIRHCRLASQHGVLCSPPDRDLHQLLQCGP
mmetsp:Transcript_50509/g.145589  ORF Transcript_50509/g.145589 Transcript_50509/m.145589 type:complete len:289 (+) Transcript_50509:661-1527(+)